MEWNVRTMSQESKRVCENCNNGIPKEECQKLIERRLSEVVRAKGGYTKY